MKLTLSVIKADIGSIGGHIARSRRLREPFITWRGMRLSPARSTYGAATLTRNENLQCK